MASIEELQPFITEPREDLATEYKDWLDLTRNEHKATLAKAAIALANHGGGYIVIGFAEHTQILISGPCPEEISEISQDSVNDAINRYADPRFHCEVYNVRHPDTNVEHPVVIVPGLFTVPVMSRRECQGVIASNCCYIRKSGPASEEPNKPEEWRTLFNRCVRANQDEMLESIRSIITGRVEMQDSRPSVLDDLRDYCTAAQDRWKELVVSAPDESPVKFSHGYYEMAFSLVNATPVNDFDELQNRLGIARQIKLSGWTPFLDIQRPELKPYPFDVFVEAWLGRPYYRQTSGDPHICDFWRASLDGKLYTIRGYLEDSRDNTPGRVFYNNLPIWRIGEGLLFSSRFAETFEEVDQIALHCCFKGLKGRSLIVHSDHLVPFDRDYPCSTDEVILTGQVTQQQIQDNLAEILHPLLQRLYEQFNFFKLPFDYVAQELRQMRSNRF